MNLMRGLEALAVALIVFATGRALRRLLVARGMKDQQVRLIVAPLVVIAIMIYFSIRVWKVF